MSATVAARGGSPVGRVASAAGSGRGAATQAMRDIGKEPRRSHDPAPPQPFGQRGFGPVASLLFVGDVPHRLLRASRARAKSTLRGLARLPPLAARRQIERISGPSRTSNREGDAMRVILALLCAAPAFAQVSHVAWTLTADPATAGRKVLVRAA